MPINDIIDATVTLAPASAPVASLSTATLLHTLTDAQDQLFGGPIFKILTPSTWGDDLTALGISSGEAAYEDVRAHFGQLYVPNKAYIGRRGKAIAQVWTVVVPSVPADGNYIVVVNGVPYSFTASSSSQAAVRTGLVTALGAGSATFTAANGGGAGDITLTSVALGTALTVIVQSPSSSMTASVTTGTKVAAVAQVWQMTIVTDAVGVYELVVQTTTGQKTYQYIAVTSDTVTTIRDGLRTLYNADPSDLFGATMTSVSTNAGTLTASLAGRPGSVTITSPASDATVAVTTANYGIAEDIAAQKAANPDAYMYVVGSHTAAELLLAAEYVETTGASTSPIMCLVQSSDANNLTDAAGNVMGALQAGLYTRTAGVYHPINAEGVHAGWAGFVLPNPPGSVSWVAKPLDGLTGNTLDSTGNASLRSNECSYLEAYPARSKNIMNGGYSFAGRPIDIIRAVDTFTFNIRAAGLDLFVNTLIVPYSQAGVTMVEGMIRTEYRKAVAQGYAIDDTLVLNVPNIETDASGDQKRRGIIPEFTGSFVVQAGAHKTILRFTVSQ